MTIMLLALPRSGEVGADAATLVSTKAAAAYAKFLGPRYNHKPRVISGLMEYQGTLTVWEPYDNGGGCVHRAGGRITVATSRSLVRRIHEDVEAYGGRLRYKAPVWGNYMAMSIDSNTHRINAWSSMPATEQVHFAQSEKFTFVSNRPLAVAFALAEGDSRKIELSQQYMMETLNYGHSISGVSPFREVFTCSPLQGISVFGRYLSTVPSPENPVIELESSEDPLVTGATELTEALLNATRRLLECNNLSQVQLRLSGGMDSRLMLALLKNFDIERLITVVQGDSTSQDVVIAEKLAAMAEVEHHTVRPELHDPTSVENSFNLSVFKAQGFMLSEALGAPYEFAAPFTVGEGYAGGHWPAFRRNYEHKRAPTMADVELELGSKNAKILKPEYNKATLDSLWLWRSSIVPSNNSDQVYLYGRDVRRVSYYHASVTTIDRDSQVFYPYMDSEVTAVSDALLVDRRMNEIAMFLANRRLWPESLSVPFSRGRGYAFEKWSPVPHISGPDYEQRKALVIMKEQADRADVDERLERLQDRDWLQSPLCTGSRYLLSSNLWSELKELLGEPIINRVERWATADNEADIMRELNSRESRIHAQLYLWRIVLAEKWLQRSWLH